MSAYITLEHVLKEILEVIKPRQEDRVSRSQVINELREVIGSVESLRGN
jgi:tRNA nucleotidyltransferase (CCA-adding enzyme)